MMYTEEMAPLERCSKCKKVVRVGLRRTTCANAAVAIWIACLESNPIHRVFSDGRNVSKVQAERWGFTVDAIPVVNDYSYVGCAIEGCPQVGVEGHHWAPKEIFGDESNQWPQSLLCDRHHKEWHRRMRDYGWNKTGEPNARID
jgi:hypothetical protein